MTRKSRGLRYLVVAMVAMLVLAPATAVAVPSPPDEVFGTVTDQNGNAVGGVTVTVTDEVGNSYTDTTDADGYYEIKFPAEDGDAGETLTVSVKDSSKTTPFESGASERIDFSITVDSDTGDTGDTGDSTGSGDTGGGGQADTTETTETPTTTEEAGGGGDEPADTTTEAPSGGEDEPSDTTTEAPTTSETGGEETTTTSEPGETTSTQTPGFGIAVSMLALIGAALIALRRRN